VSIEVSKVIKTRYLHSVVLESECVSVMKISRGRTWAL